MISRIPAEPSLRDVYLPFLADPSPQLTDSAAAAWFWSISYLLALVTLTGCWKQLNWTQRIHIWGGINSVAAIATTIMYVLESSGLRAAGYPVLAPYMASGFIWAFIWSPVLPLLIITSCLLTRLRSHLLPEDSTSP